MWECCWLFIELLWTFSLWQVTIHENIIRWQTRWWDQFIVGIMTTKMFQYYFFPFQYQFWYLEFGSEHWSDTKISIIFYIYAVCPDLSRKICCAGTPINAPIKAAVVDADAPRDPPDSRRKNYSSLLSDNSCQLQRSTASRLYCFLEEQKTIDLQYLIVSSTSGADGQGPNYVVWSQSIDSLILIPVFPALLVACLILVSG